MTFYHPHPCLIIAFWLGTLFSYLSTIPLLYTLPGKSHRWRSLVGCSPWGRWELDTTERLHFHFSLSCIGEGNGNPLQCSCLENPRDGGAWWLPSMGSHRVGHDWSDLAAAAAAIFYCVYVPLLSFPFVCRWTSRLLPCPGYYKTVLRWTLGYTWLFQFWFPWCPHGNF